MQIKLHKVQRILSEEDNIFTSGSLTVYLFEVFLITIHPNILTKNV